MQSIRAKIVILGIMLPLLSSALLMQYYGWRTGFMEMEAFLVWGALATMSFISLW